MRDVNCPYCGEPQEICHDDGQGYQEDVTHSQECVDCDKTFAYTTSIHYYYEARQADCMNAGEHKYELITAYPKRYSRMSCSDCDHERELTDQERLALGDEYVMGPPK